MGDPKKLEAQGEILRDFLEAGHARGWAAGCAAGGASSALRPAGF
ncbi:MAG: hypothetical protein U0797_02715 [Gemmataceae bacterium]